MQTTTAATRTVPASFRKRYDKLMAFNERCASVAARERHRKAWATLERDLKAKGFEMVDLY